MLFDFILLTFGYFCIFLGRPLEHFCIFNIIFASFVIQSTKVHCYYFFIMECNFYPWIISWLSKKTEVTTFVPQNSVDIASLFFWCSSLQSKSLTPFWILFFGKFPAFPTQLCVEYFFVLLIQKCYHDKSRCLIFVYFNWNTMYLFDRQTLYSSGKFSFIILLIIASAPFILVSSSG